MLLLLPHNHMFGVTLGPRFATTLVYQLMWCGTGILLATQRALVTSPYGITRFSWGARRGLLCFQFERRKKKKEKKNQPILYYISCSDIEEEKKIQRLDPLPILSVSCDGNVCMYVYVPFLCLGPRGAKQVPVQALWPQRILFAPRGSRHLKTPQNR